MSGILGLDLSLTATGWATSLDDHGVYSPGSLRGVERLVHLSVWLMGVTWDDPRGVTTTDLAVIEGYAYSKGNQAHQVGEWGGVARFTLHRIGIPFVVVPPSTLKKYATGRGNATKADMRMSLYKRTGMDISDDNEVDAIWLCAAGHQAIGDPLWDMPKAQVEALAKVEWPTKENN